MSQENKNFIIINGSPKTTSKSVSGELAEQAASLFSGHGIQSDIVHVRSLNSAAIRSSFSAMRSADALLLIFPLYFFCVPSMLIQFLEDYADYLSIEGRLSSEQTVYAIVNCGFPEPNINEEAVRVMKSFSRHIGAAFRFGVCIGSGGMITEAREAPFMKKAVAQLDTTLMRMAQDSSAVPAEDVSISVSFPRKLYFFMGNRGWYGMARKNNLNKKDLFARPYQNV